MGDARIARSRHDEYAALMVHARSLTESETPIPTPRPAPVRKRVVLVHRNAWFRGRVRETLEQAGVDVVAELDDGAQAVGTIVAEQPDLALVEDLLPSYPGLEAVARLRRHCPDVLVAVALAGSSQARSFLAHGVQVVSTRRMPPAEVASELLRCLEAARPQGGARPGVLV